MSDEDTKAGAKTLSQLSPCCYSPVMCPEATSCKGVITQYALTFLLTVAQSEAPQTVAARNRGHPVFFTLSTALSGAPGDFKHAIVSHLKVQFRPCCVLSVGDEVLGL